MKEIWRAHRRSIMVVAGIALLAPLVLVPAGKHLVLPAIQWLFGDLYDDVRFRTDAFLMEYYKLFGTALAMMPGFWLAELLLLRRALAQSSAGTTQLVRDVAGLRRLAASLVGADGVVKAGAEAERAVAEVKEGWFQVRAQAMAVPGAYAWIMEHRPGFFAGAESAVNSLLRSGTDESMVNSTAARALEHELDAFEMRRTS